MVAGAFGTTPVKADTAGRAWAKLRDDTVIPYASEWANDSVPGAAAQLAIAGPKRTESLRFDGPLGYYGLKLTDSAWGFGTFTLTLSPAGAAGTQAATLFRSADGSIISLE